MDKKKQYQYKVCTLCTTYNQAPYIVDAMNGFSMQETTFPFVTIIIDDASTDGEQEIIRQYIIENFGEPYCNSETEYAQIICANHKSNPHCIFVAVFLKYNHYRIKKNKYAYLSKWLDNAKYRALCEGDDYWIDSHKLQKQADFLDNHHELSCSFTRYNILLQNSGEIFLSDNRKFNKKKHYYFFDKKDAFFSGWITKSCTCMARSEVLAKGENFFSQLKYGRRDVNLVYWLLTHGGGVCHSFVGSVYRLNNTSIYGGLTEKERAIVNYDVYQDLYKVTKDKMLRRCLAGGYAFLYAQGIKPYNHPHNLFEWYAVLVYRPYEKLTGILKRLYLRFF